MKIDRVKHAPVPAITGEGLLAAVPDASRYAAVEVKNVSNVPSDDMDRVRWTALTRDVTAALDHGAKRLVVQALGWGNVNQSTFAAIRDAVARAVPVVISTPVPNGRVLPNYGWEGGGRTLVEAGAVMADDLSPQKARILFMLLLQHGVTGQKALQAEFDR